jgi:hypothetical protein
MWEALTQYYGLDWIAFGLGQLGSILVGSKEKKGFILSILSVSCSLCVSVMIASIPFIIANASSLLIYSRNYYCWHRDEVEADASNRDQENQSASSAAVKASF